MISVNPPDTAVTLPFSSTRAISGLVLDHFSRGTAVSGVTRVSTVYTSPTFSVSGGSTISSVSGYHGSYTVSTVCALTPLCARAERIV